ncbi:Transcription repressor [Heracleum sosnowskyi]|uniref:Transcription repressor n=1 Tax=Heracleum sosnowskyi TaxID=360622 RepID=A0AAD8GXE8_9APIA|nr:Transcription repressor [Heracleum sosnowskyi]
MSAMDPFILLVIVELNQPLSSKEAQRNLKTHVAKKNDNIGDEKRCLVRKLRVNSVGVKLRAKSRRIASKKLTQVQCREIVSSHSHLMSVAIVEESIDPDRDFKESMMEMIMEHNMSTKEEFEQLLACYLSLNPGIYHELIVKVFEQIWFEITGN